MNERSEQSNSGFPSAPSDAALGRIVHGFTAVRVLVIGDLILDRYVTGQAGRLSPEAPIPVLRPAATRAIAGGAANVAANIAELGGQAVLVGLVGQDQGAAELRRLLAACPSIRAVLVEAPGRPTTTKTRFMSGAHQLLRLDEESTDPADPAAVAALCAACDAAMAEVAVVVLSDYAKGVLAGPVLDHVLAAAAAAGRPVIADPKRPDFAAYRGATVLTPNEAELRAADGSTLADSAAVEAAAARALCITEGQAVLVTRSEKGMAVIRADAPPLHLPARAREVADVSGAGDTVVAALAVALAAGAGARRRGAPCQHHRRAVGRQAGHCHRFAHTNCWARCTSKNCWRAKRRSSPRPRPRRASPPGARAG